MRPHLFLDLAEQLAEDTGPAAHRYAISRAYYAVFNIAEEFFDRMGIPRAKRDYHVVVQRRLLACGDEELSKFGSQLGDFHHDRIRADYQMSDKEVEDESYARTAVKDASRMARAFEDCPIYSERWKSIKEAVRKIEKL
jgi:hypothetical protein